MTDLQAKKSTYTREPGALKKTLKKVLGKVLTVIPAIIIFGLIALYYIQLSHMA